MINLLPEASSAPPQARRRYHRRSIAAALIFAIAFPLAIWLKSTGRAEAASLAVYVLTLAVLGFMTYEFVRLMASLDELQQRIHLTALAIGFGAAGLAVTFWGMSALFFIDTPRDGFTAEEGAFAMPGGIVIYYIALHVLTRRYR